MKGWLQSCVITSYSIHYTKLYEHFERNAVGELTQINDHNGALALSFSYENDLLTQVTDRAGRRVSYTWEGSGSSARLKVVTTLGQW